LKTEQSSDAFTWLLGLDYQPVDDVLLYTKYVRGYRQGLVNPRALQPYKSFGPEQVDSYEIGTKTHWQGPLPGLFNVAVFYNDFKEQQVIARWRQAGQTASAIVNAGKSVIWGVEADASIFVLDDLKLTAAFTYLNAEIEAVDQPAAPPPFTGADALPIVSPGFESLPFSPKHKYSVTATYSLPLPEAIGEISFGATYSHTDGYISQPSVFGMVESFSLLNLNLNWNGVGGGPVDLSLFATNATDEHYYTYSSDNFPGVGVVSKSVGDPRMYGMRVRYRYGASAE
jgi:iron complex outermembrane receptor protein